MKRFIAILGLVLGLAGFTGLVTAPAEASAPVHTAVTAPVVATSQTAVPHGIAMGGLPNYWTICVANGYGPTAGVINHWNWTGYRLSVRLQNRCDGYSIYNRLTIESTYQSSGTCIFYTNTGRTSGTQLRYGLKTYYIWNQNPVVWINTAPQCFRDNIQLYHNIQKGVGYILGLAYSTDALSIMGPDSNDIAYVQSPDAGDMNQIYRQP